jgi:hypothetical protein
MDSHRCLWLRLPLAAVGALCTLRHGGKTANPPWLLHWPRPRAVAVSQWSSLPGVADALAPQERRGIPLSRTWQRGAIRFRFDPEGIATGGFLDRDEEIGLLSLASPLVLGLLSTPSVIGLVGFLAGVVACVLLAVVEYGAWALVVPPRAREKEGSEAEASHGPGDVNPDRALPISVEAADGAKLAGLWYPAEGA